RTLLCDHLIPDLATIVCDFADEYVHSHVSLAAPAEIEYHHQLSYRLRNIDFGRHNIGLVVPASAEPRAGLAVRGLDTKTIRCIRTVTFPFAVGDLYGLTDRLVVTHPVRRGQPARIVDLVENQVMKELLGFGLSTERYIPMDSCRFGYFNNIQSKRTLAV